ncbi:MAG: tripartite tricarboxylate transporter TctB family protein [Burkholderiales bacterium]
MRGRVFGGRVFGQDFAGGLAIVAVAVFAWWLARGLPGGSGSGGGMGPGTLPKALAVLLGLLGALLAVNAVVKTQAAPPLERWSLRGPLLILGALVLFGITVRPLGLAVAGPLAIGVGAFGSHEVRWRETLLFGLAMTVFCIGLFKFALGLPIPLAPWLIGY